MCFWTNKAQSQITTGASHTWKQPHAVSGQLMGVKEALPGSRCFLGVVCVWVKSSCLNLLCNCRCEWLLLWTGRNCPFARSRLLWVFLLSVLNLKSRLHTSTQRMLWADVQQKRKPGLLFESSLNRRVLNFIVTVNVTLKTRVCSCSSYTSQDTFRWPYDTN